MIKDTVIGLYTTGGVTHRALTARSIKRTASLLENARRSHLAPPLLFYSPSYFVLFENNFLPQTSIRLLLAKRGVRIAKPVNDTLYALPPQNK